MNRLFWICIGSLMTLTGLFIYGAIVWMFVTIPIITDSDIFHAVYSTVLMSLSALAMCGFGIHIVWTEIKDWIEDRRIFPKW